MTQQIDKNFVQGFTLVIGILGNSSFDLPGVETPQQLQGQDLPDSYAKPNYREPPPEWCDTANLEDELKTFAADQNADGKGLPRTRMDAASRQTQYLLDLQRHAANRSIPRVERIARAALRRRSVSARNGPYRLLEAKVLQDLANSSLTYKSAD